jgi:hypothetical protein
MALKSAKAAVQSRPETTSAGRYSSDISKGPASRISVAPEIST